jgi:hypothetical protein
MTEQGFNLLNPTDLKKFSPSFDLLPVLVAAIVKAIGEYGMNDTLMTLLSTRY